METLNDTVLKPLPDISDHCMVRMKICLTSWPNKQNTVPKDELENLKDPEVFMNVFKQEKKKKKKCFSDFDDVANSDDVQVIIDLQPMQLKIV